MEIHSFSLSDLYLRYSDYDGLCLDALRESASRGSFPAAVGYLHFLLRESTIRHALPPEIEDSFQKERIEALALLRSFVPASPSERVFFFSVVRDVSPISHDRLLAEIERDELAGESVLLDARRLRDRL